MFEPSVLSLPVAALPLQPTQLGVNITDGVLLKHQLLLLLVQVPGTLLNLLTPKADLPPCVAHLTSSSALWANPTGGPHF